MLISWYKRDRMCVTSVPNRSGRKVCCHLSLSITCVRSSIEVRSHVRTACPGEPLESGRGELAPAPAGSARLGALLLCPHYQCTYPWWALADLTGGGHVTGAPGARPRPRFCCGGGTTSRWWGR